VYVYSHRIIKRLFRGLGVCSPEICSVRLWPANDIAARQCGVNFNADEYHVSLRGTAVSRIYLRGTWIPSSVDPHGPLIRSRHYINTDEPLWRLLPFLPLIHQRSDCTCLVHALLGFLSSLPLFHYSVSDVTSHIFHSISTQALWRAAHPAMERAKAWQ
jgi:hypothetical protein